MFRRCAALVALLVIASVAPAAPFQAFSHPLHVGPFTLTERSGKTVTREDLRGKVWVAHFFYCTCQEGCTKTTATMARLQQALAWRKNVVLASIHVNPSPEEGLAELNAFAESHGADPERWLFLTGPQDIIDHSIQEGFHLSVVRSSDKPAGFAIDHSLWLILIDPEGRMLGYVDGRDADAVDELVAQIERVAPPTFQERARGILPAANATLNGLCTMLLVVGWLAIRRRMETLHKACMLGALAVSVVFLASYLYYHFAILDGRPTRFRGEGAVRIAYFAILLSHTILATVVAPLALVTAYLGLRDRRAAHRRLARWVWPAWLYVSITGVIVYLMLYHL
jgi:protein SCO1/2/putative membrane protein